MMIPEYLHLEFFAATRDYALRKIVEDILAFIPADTAYTIDSVTYTAVYTMGNDIAHYKVDAGVTIG